MSEDNSQFNTDKSLRRIQAAGFASILAMLAVIGGWTAMSQLNGAVVASATVVSESYSKKIQHRDGGIVKKIMVRDGDTVKAGQDLVILDPTETKAELGIIDAGLDENRVRRIRLEAMRDGQRDIVLPSDLKDRANDDGLARIIKGQKNLLISTLDSAKGKRDQFEQQIGQLNEQISGITAQIESKQTQAKLINDELDSLKKLRRDGLVPVNRVLGVEREAAAIAGEQGELRANRAAAQGRIGEIKIEMIQLDEQVRNQALTELRETDAKIAELQERRIASSARLTRMSIKAPIDGVIYQVVVHTEGGVIAPGEALMALVPEGDELVLQAQVAPQDVDQVVTGQSAQIRFPGFNSRTTPEISAKVVQVAADVSRADAQSPPYYAVRLSISPDQIQKLGSSKLRPGMSADAFIQTEASTPLYYLTKPLIEQIRHSMNES